MEFRHIAAGGLGLAGAGYTLAGVESGLSGLVLHLMAVALFSTMVAMLRLETERWRTPMVIGLVTGALAVVGILFVSLREEAEHVRAGLGVTFVGLLIGAAVGGLWWWSLRDRPDRARLAALAALAVAGLTALGAGLFLSPDGGGLGASGFMILVGFVGAGLALARFRFDDAEPLPEGMTAESTG